MNLSSLSLVYVRVFYARSVKSLDIASIVKSGIFGFNHFFILIIKNAF